MKTAKKTIFTARPLWLVKRTGEIGYDEYKSCVVAASDKTAALTLAYSLWGDASPVECEEIGTTKKPSGIIHNPYCAG